MKFKVGDKVRFVDKSPAIPLGHEGLVKEFRIYHNYCYGVVWDGDLIEGLWWMAEHELELIE